MLSIKKPPSLGIGSKLTIGFGVLVGITLLVVGLGFVAGLSATNNIKLTEELREPILFATMETQTSLLKSQLHMRGYLVSGNTYDAEQYEVSKKIFEKGLNALGPLLAKSNTNQDIQHIADLGIIYKEWVKLPPRLFALHDNPLENRLALQLSRVEVQPLRTQVLEEIDDLLKDLTHDQRPPSALRIFSEDLIRFRMSFGAMVGDLAAFAASGEKDFKFAYGANAAANIAIWDKVFVKRSLLSAYQREKLDVIGGRRAEVAGLAQKIFTIVESDRAYEDLYLYRTQAVPQAERMMALLGKVAKRQQGLFSQDLHQARASLELARNETVIGGLTAVVVGISMAFLLWRNIVGSLRRLTGVAEQIAGGDLSIRAKVESGDEIGVLATTLNTMTQRLSETISKLETAFVEAKKANEQKEAANVKLQATQRELVDTARRTGMAEIASNVLHNVGNVLNSVNVSAGLISRQMQTSKVSGLTKAVQLINDNAAQLGNYLTHDEKGKLLPVFLNELSKTLAAEQKNILEEIAMLTKSIDHIKDIVATQQAYAGTSSIVEPVNVQDLLDDALRMNTGALIRHNITIVKDINAVPTLPLDKHRILQIVVNLIGNAKQAMNGMENPCITLCAALVNTANRHVLRITVTDNGEGITPENMSRLFAHGFTTRKNGHGFGLHSCVLAAKEMGGILTAHSDGPGQGATFTLDIPIDAPESSNEYPA